MTDQVNEVPARNVNLIGMPGSGKSTVGVLLAKTMGLGFLDTDVTVQALECRRLQEIIDAEGDEGFRRIERASILSLDLAGHVIATGGSAVYYEDSMRHLQQCGPVVYLRIGLAELTRRLTNLGTRGVLMGPGQTLADLYAQRTPLYEQWADVTVDCAGKTQEQIVDEIAAAVGA